MESLKEKVKWFSSIKMTNTKEISKTVKPMDKESIKTITKNSLFKANGKIRNLKKESFSSKIILTFWRSKLMISKWGKLGYFTKISESTMDQSINNFLHLKVKDSFYLLMVQHTKEAGKMVWCMDLEPINGKMDRNMKGIIWTVRSKEMAYFITHLGSNMLECGPMESSMVSGK